MSKVFQTHFGRGDNVAGKIVINGKSYVGNNININKNGDVIVDGQKQDELESKNNVFKVQVSISGDPENIELRQGDITIDGDCQTVKVGQGDVNIVGGDNNVYGNVSTGQGSIDIRGKVMGNVSTGQGDIKHRR